MSFELKIDPKRRAAGRFIGTVRKALINAAINEKQARGLSQQKVADCLGVNRSVVNRMLRGDMNLTLRSVAELAWAMGWKPQFSMEKVTVASERNVADELPPYATTRVLNQSASTTSPPRVYNASAPTKNYYHVAAE